MPNSSPSPRETVPVTPVERAPRRKTSRTKQQIGLSLLKRSKGASIAEMQKAMGWQAHSVRGFLAGTVKKMPSVTLVSNKTKSGPRRYRVQLVAE